MGNSQDTHSDKVVQKNAVSATSSSSSAHGGKGNKALPVAAPVLSPQQKLEVIPCTTKAGVPVEVNLDTISLANIPRFNVKLGSIINVKITEHVPDLNEGCKWCLREGVLVRKQVLSFVGEKTPETAGSDIVCISMDVNTSYTRVFQFRADKRGTAVVSLQLKRPEDVFEYENECYELSTEFVIPGPLTSPSPSPLSSSYSPSPSSSSSSSAFPSTFPSSSSSSSAPASGVHSSQINTHAHAQQQHEQFLILDEDREFENEEDELKIAETLWMQMLKRQSVRTSVFTRGRIARENSEKVGKGVEQNMEKSGENEKNKSKEKTCEDGVVQGQTAAEDLNKLDIKGERKENGSGETLLIGLVDRAVAVNNETGGEKHGVEAKNVTDDGAESEQKAERRGDKEEGGTNNQGKETGGEEKRGSEEKCEEEGFATVVDAAVEHWGRGKIDSSVVMHRCIIVQVI